MNNNKLIKVSSIISDDTLMLDGDFKDSQGRVGYSILQSGAWNMDSANCKVVSCGVMIRGLPV